jgi:hypothetical protein
MLTFFGHLLLYAARSEVALGLDLPPLFWHLLVGGAPGQQQPPLELLRDIDAIAYTPLARLRAAALAVLSALAAPPPPPPLPPRPSTATSQTPRYVAYYDVYGCVLLLLLLLSM